MGVRLSRLAERKEDVRKKLKRNPHVIHHNDKVCKYGKIDQMVQIICFIDPSFCHIINRQSDKQRRQDKLKK